MKNPSEYARIAPTGALTITIFVVQHDWLCLNYNFVSLSPLKASAIVFNTSKFDKDFLYQYVTVLEMRPIHWYQHADNTEWHWSQSAVDILEDTNTKCLLLPVQRRSKRKLRRNKFRKKWWTNMIEKGERIGLCDRSCWGIHWSKADETPLGV